jgi:hypothetical protein
LQKFKGRGNFGDLGIDGPRDEKFIHTFSPKTLKEDTTWEVYAMK